MINIEDLINRIVKNKNSDIRMNVYGRSLYQFFMHKDGEKGDVFVCLHVA